MGTKRRQVDHSIVNSSDSNPESEAKPNESVCPHLKKSLLESFIRKSSLKQVCSDCERNAKNVSSSMPEEASDNEDKDSLFICMRCGECRCRIHGKKHSINKQNDVHDVAYNYVSDVVWCFKCDTKINESQCELLRKCVDIIKKMSRLEKEKPSLKLTEDESIGNVNYEGTFVIRPLLSDLPRARGLANLGNTCFFNSVLQCLAHTPFLLDVLEEMHSENEAFRLPGGEVQIGDDKINLAPLEGNLKKITPKTLTYSLIETLRELQSDSDRPFTPHQLKAKLDIKCPQFEGFGQHDAHELLRQLLETVRNEDSDRHKKVILQKLGLENKSDIEAVTGQKSRVVKAYGRQVGDLLLRPSMVFRGELVSILQRIKCKHTTHHVEHFLDLSLPVSADKPVYSRHRTNSETNDNKCNYSKHQQKKERKAATKRKNSKYMHVQKSSDAQVDKPDGSNSSGDDSDADNEEEVEPNGEINNDIIESGYSSEKPCNGDSGSVSPSETQMDQSSSAMSTGLLDDNSTLIHTLNTNSNEEPLCSDPVSAVPDEQSKSSESKFSSSENPRTNSLSLNLPPVITLPHNPLPIETSNCKLEPLISGLDDLIVGPLGDSSVEAEAVAQVGGTENSADTPLEGEGHGEYAGAIPLVSPLSPAEGDVEEADANSSQIDGDLLMEMYERTLSPRVTGSPDKCTLNTCLNSFTAVELLKGNNKVSCDECTEQLSKRSPGKGAKVVYSDASKQFLILHPPAILILHLKRFQAQRLFSRKNDRLVTFEPTLDIASFCSTNSSLIRKGQSEIRYALYGIVQHSGTMHGGHYVAHVKVRKALTKEDPRWAFVASSDSSKKSLQIGPSEPPPAPPGKWYCISDSHVMESDEARVLDSEAYLLFYERIW